ncbi:dinitrogenase iron-molybdenum cofactor biosynthesis protein [Microgenomates bacterium DG_75]|nr:MAG: dinitrogenase iron-molybdenum cofactor biosynthesis protein [Microgenomates bacterium DG_75]
MKIAIASSGKTLDSPVDPRFGRCPYFLIVDSETEEFEVLENTAGQASRGAGISAAQVVANKKVGAAVAGNFGPNAVNVLSSSGIKIFGGVSGITIKEALEQYKKGELKETTAATTPAGMGMGRGMGRGGGWGRGRQ